MKKKYKDLEQKQLLKKLNDISKVASSCKRPSQGWIRSVRKALGMTTTQLAKRLKVTQSRVSEIEKDELSDQITLKTLRKVANSLGCELEYVLVSERPLEQILEERALFLARQKVQYISQHMELEDQALSDEEKENQIRNLANELLKKPQKLWES